MNGQDVFYAEVGQRIRHARDQRGLTQEGLATLVALTRTSITNIEKGRQKLLLHTLVDLATALQVTPADLLPPVTNAGEQELDTLLKGRSREEKQWIKSTVLSVRKAEENGR